MLTRKHFKNLAHGLSLEKPDGSDKTIAMRTWVRSCLAVAGVCHNSNPRFDKQRFLEACGVPDKYIR